MIASVLKNVSLRVSFSDDPEMLQAMSELDVAIAIFTTIGLFFWVRIILAIDRDQKQLISGV